MVYFDSGLDYPKPTTTSPNSPRHGGWTCTASPPTRHYSTRSPSPDCGTTPPHRHRGRGGWGWICTGCYLPNPPGTPIRCSGLVRHGVCVPTNPRPAGISTPAVAGSTGSSPARRDGRVRADLELDHRRRLGTHSPPPDAGQPGLRPAPAAGRARAQARDPHLIDGNHLDGGRLTLLCRGSPALFDTSPTLCPDTATHLARPMHRHSPSRCDLGRRHVSDVCQVSTRAWAVPADGLRTRRSTPTTCHRGGVLLPGVGELMSATEGCGEALRRDTLARGTILQPTMETT